MRAMTFDQMRQLNAGEMLGCFVFGAVFALSIGAGSIPGALASGYYLASNCFS